MFGQAFDKSLVDRARTYRKDAIRPRHPRSYQRLKSHRIRVRFISTFQIVESMGFKGEFRQWEHLLRLDALLSIRAGEMAQVARRQAEVGQAEAARLTFDQAVDLACARDPPMGICLQGAGAGSDCEGTGVVREVGPGV